MSIAPPARGVTQPRHRYYLVKLRRYIYIVILINISTHDNKIDAIRQTIFTSSADSDNIQITALMIIFPDRVTRRLTAQ